MPYPVKFRVQMLIFLRTKYKSVWAVEKIGSIFKTHANEVTLNSKGALMFLFDFSFKFPCYRKHQWTQAEV